MNRSGSRIGVGIMRAGAAKVAVLVLSMVFALAPSASASARSRASRALPRRGGGRGLHPTARRARAPRSLGLRDHGGAARAIRRRAAVRLRGALPGPPGLRPLRPGRPIPGLQRQRPLGGQPARRGRRHAALLHPRRGPGRRARGRRLQRAAHDRGRGRRPGGPVQHLPGPDPQRRAARRGAPRWRLHLGHPRRVGAGHTRTVGGRPVHLGRELVLRGLSGQALRRGHRQRLPRHAPGVDPLRRGQSSRPTSASAGRPTPSWTTS